MSRTDNDQGRVIHAGAHVHVLDDGQLAVTGPAIVRTATGSEYEVTTDLTLKFKPDTEVWLKWESR